MILFFIMHYLTYVFVPKHKDPSSAVDEVMRPYGDDFQVKPWKRYVDSMEIAAMAKYYKLPRNALHKLAEKLEVWCGGVGGVDSRGLYAVVKYNPDARWDWYEIGGRWQLGWRDHAIFARTLLHSPKLKELLPHDFLTPDGVWHSKSRYVKTGWCEGHIVHRAERRWRDELKLALASWPHHRVVCVDIHS